HGGAERAVPGVEHLVPEQERVVAHVDHTALDVEDVANAKLALEAHVDVGGGRGHRGEAQRVEHGERRVAEPLEVEGHREVVGPVDLPALHDAADGLSPAHLESFRPMRFSITCVPAEKSSAPQPFATASSNVRLVSSRIGVGTLAVFASSSASPASFSISSAMKDGEKSPSKMRFARRST